MPRIKKLSVKACRGIRDITLDLNGESLILLGENGRGKSSFVDAFELLFKNQINHLDEAKSTSTKRHAPHILFDENDTKIKIENINPEATIEWTFDGIEAEPNHQISFIEAGRAANFILRRKQILEFIIATPAGRYEQIAKVIGIANLDDIELNLKRRKDEIYEQVIAFDKQVKIHEGDLSTKFDIKLFDEKSILSGLNKRLKELGQNELQTFDEIEHQKLAAIKGTKDPGQIQLATKLEKIANLISYLKNKNDFLGNHQKLWDAIEEFKKDVSLARDLAFQQVISQGQQLIIEFQPKTCPICEQPIDLETLLPKLEKRLELLETARDKSSKISRLKGELKGELENLDRKVKELKNELVEYDQKFDHSIFTQFVELINSILSKLKINNLNISLPPLSSYIDSPTMNKWEQTLDKLDLIIEGKMKKLNVSENDHKALQAIELMNFAYQTNSKLEESKSKKKIKQTIECTIKKAFDLFVSTKKKEIQKIYQNIEKDLQKFYDILHPNEEHRKIALEIDPKKRSSTEIKMGFHDREDDPRAFQSEAHLDSLGLCTFLAFVKNFNNDFSLVILDDVVGTIDSQHRRRVCKLLYTEFKDYQLFITTHDDLWFKELVAHQLALNVRHQFNNIQILDWSLENGLILDYHKMRWEIVDERLSERDKVSAAAHTRRNLEWVLYKMAINMRVKVPINPSGRYVVSDLYLPFKNRLKKLLPGLFSKNEDIFTHLEADGIFGNLLTHNNLKAENASIDEIRAFAEAVKNLHDLVTCENQQFLEYHQSANIMKCKCGHINLETK